MLLCTDPPTPTPRHIHTCARTHAHTYLSITFANLAPLNVFSGLCTLLHDALQINVTEVGVTCNCDDGEVGLVECVGDCENSFAEREHFLKLKITTWPG